MKQISDKEINEVYERRAMIIAFNIAQVRKKKGLSQMELAFFTNTAQSVILYAERGKNKQGKPYIPTMLTIEKIAVACNVTLMELIQR